MRGQVVKLDRGFPLVKLADGALVRCEHATELVKGADKRCVIGDEVQVELPDAHDMGQVTAICDRRNQLVRKDPSERAIPQVLAANFDMVIVAQPLAEVNVRRLERELVLAFETGARVVVVLTKADLADDEEVAARVRADVTSRVGADVAVLVVSEQDLRAVGELRDMLRPDHLAVLIGRSGVGKSSLVNLLVGRDVQQTAAVREGDGKGRHTTVSREMVDIPGGGRVVDMPGVRGLGVWEAEAGIGAAFADIEEYASQCRFRDCTHTEEPGCAVRAALQEGKISSERLESYLGLHREVSTMRERKEQARRKAGTKHSDRKKPQAKTHSRRRS